MRLASLALGWTVVACLACGDSKTDPQFDPITRIDAEPPGEHCAAGGQAVRAGLDRNRDGQLQDGEITGTDYVCAEPARTLLVRSAPEPAGASCAQGGTVVYAGLDDDGDGALTDDEIDRTTYLCAEDEPAVVVRTSATAADATCPTGGTRVESGRDRDGDASLEAGEIEQSTVVCGPDVLVRTDEVGSADACRGNKATRVRSGPDADADGTLDDGEIVETEYVCSAETYAFYVRSQADLDYLAHVGVVRGDLIIESTTLTDVSVFRVVVTGAIRVRDCPALKELTLWPDMAGGDIEVARTPALTRLSIQIDPSIYTPRYLPILGTLSVTDAPALGSLFLDRVPYIQGSLVLLRAGLPSLMADDTLDYNKGLEWIGGDFRIEDCDRIHGVTMTRLTRIGGSFILRGNAVMERWDDGLWTGNQISSVGERTSWGGDVVVEDNPMMIGVYLDALTAVKGGIFVRNNALLGGISHRALATLGDDYVVTDNAALTHVGTSQPEPVPLSIGGAIQVERNPELLGLWGFEPLRRAEQGIQIRDNAKLRWVTMGALPSAPSIAIERNASLEYLGPSDQNFVAGSLVGLASCDTFILRDNAALTRLELPALTEVASLRVQGNASLPTCQAEALATQANANPNLTVISGNLDGGTCD